MNYSWHVYLFAFIGGMIGGLIYQYFIGGC